jgi:hypothetical protein
MHQTFRVVCQPHNQPGINSARARMHAKLEGESKRTQDSYNVTIPFRTRIPFGIDKTDGSHFARAENPEEQVRFATRSPKSQKSTNSTRRLLAVEYCRDTISLGIIETLFTMLGRFLVKAVTAMFNIALTIIGFSLICAPGKPIPFLSEIVFTGKVHRK